MVGDYKQVNSESQPVIIPDKDDMNIEDIDEIMGQEQDAESGLLYTDQEIQEGIAIDEEDPIDATTDESDVCFDDSDSDFDDDIDGDEEEGDEFYGLRSSDIAVQFSNIKEEGLYNISLISLYVQFNSANSFLVTFLKDLILRSHKGREK